MVKHLLRIRDLAAADLRQILDLAHADDGARPLTGQGAALYFEKPSARTRNSMEMAVVQLGGHPVYLQEAELGIGHRESAEDVARTLGCYHRLIAARVSDHGVLERMAAVSPVPIVNLLSASDHPLQALADLLTIEQLLGRIEGARVAFVGEWNNVARSLAEACALVGAEFAIASPAGFGPPEPVPGVLAFADPAAAVRGADIVYADVWVSMGDEDSEDRRRAFAPYRVDSALMDLAPDGWFLHCLPARRGEEVSAEVIDGPRSAIWRQAANRMHSARGALRWLLAD